MNCFLLQMKRIAAKSFIRLVFDVHSKPGAFPFDENSPWVSRRDLLHHDYTPVTIVIPLDLFSSVLHVAVVKRGR